MASYIPVNYDSWNPDGKGSIEFAIVARPQAHAADTIATHATESLDRDRVLAFGLVVALNVLNRKKIPLTWIPPHQVRGRLSQTRNDRQG